MIERVAPAVVVFVGSTWVTQRPKVLSRLPSWLVARVPFVRYDPKWDFESAFIEETRHKIDQAAGYLVPGLAPALPIILISDPAILEGPPPLATLLCRACPAHLKISPQWLGVYRPETFPAWEDAARMANATFLLSTLSRHGPLQGVGLLDSFQSLVLTFIATETSRFSAPGWESFTSMRFGPSGRIFLTSVDYDHLPDFDAESGERVEAAVAAHYFPRITETAHLAATSRTPFKIETFLSHPGPRAVFEANLAETLLCTAIARSDSLDQSIANLSHWAGSANSAVAELLEDLQVGLQGWMVDARSRDFCGAYPSLAEPLLKAGGFPALHRLGLPFVSSRPGSLWKKLVEDTRTAMIDETRTILDERHYEYLPHDLSQSQRSSRVARSMGEPAEEARVIVSRHLPSELAHDMRQEILCASQMSTVLYSMERSRT